MGARQRVAVIPGDGIGPEVTEQGVRALERLGVPLSLEPFDFGAERYLATGVGLPAGQLEAFRRDFQAVLLGAIGDARVKDQAHARDILLGLRQGLDLYVNFRPARLLHPRLCPLKGPPGGGERRVDIALFRENTEGMYGGALVVRGGPGGEVHVAEEVHSSRGVERLLRAGFTWARAHGRRRVTLVDKANAVPAHRLWREGFARVAADFPELEADARYADAAALELVQRPEAFDVVVTTNLFGDLLSDLTAGLVGGLGVAPSANLHPGGGPPLFEPVHGSAPELAGRNVANPFAMLLTCALLLGELGHAEEAARLEAAVAACVAAGECTADLGGALSTRAAADAVLRRL